MKYLMILVIGLSSQMAFAGLSDAISAAIKTSDTEKNNTKVALRVSEDEIEKATFKRGQKTKVIKDNAELVVDVTPYVAPTSDREEVIDDVQVDLSKELSDMK